MRSRGSHSSAMLATEWASYSPCFLSGSNSYVGRRKDSVCARSRPNAAEHYFPPGHALSNSYFPDPTSTTTSSPACRAPDKSARPVNGFPPSVTCSSFAFGNRAVAVVFGGTSTCNTIFPSASFQPDSTCPYRVSTDAFADVNPPPGRGWIKVCLYPGCFSSISIPATTRYIQSPIAPYA